MQFSTPDAAVRGLVRRTLGRELVAELDVLLGGDNEVHEVRVEGNETVIVRFRFGGDVGIAAEAWAIEQVRQAGCPVPRIYFAGECQIGGRTKEVSVQEKVEGRPLAAVLEELSDTAFGDACRELGRVLGSIHGIEVGGFGTRQPSGMWEFRDWRQYVRAEIAARESNRESILAAGSSAKDFGDMLSLVRRWERAALGPEPILCHGDVEPQHIFVDQRGEITGVIDFGSFLGGIALLDLRGMAMWSRPLDWQSFAEGYPDQRWFDELFEKRLHAFRVGPLMRHLSYLLWRRPNGADLAIETTTQMLRETLEYAR